MALLRHSVVAARLLAAVMVCASLYAQSTSAQWVGAWATAPESPNGGARYFEQETIREIVHLSVGGSAVRVRLSNQFGQNPIRIEGAHVALRAQNAKIIEGSDRTLQFNGQQVVTIPAGAVMWSDAVKLDAPALGDLAVSLYFAAPVPETTVHQGALQTNYEVKGGDFTSAPDLAVVGDGDIIKFTSYPFLTGVDVADANARGVIVALGDSITDGYSSHDNTNHRWPNLLADRLHAAGKEFGVLNAGISSNRLLHDGAPGGRFSPGPNALARFDTDVLAQTGVTHVIVLEGINDLGHPGQSAPSTEQVSAEEMIGAFRQFILRAHAHGIKIYGCTILPFEGTIYPGYYNTAKDAQRQKVNEWMRSGKEFDAVFDLDKALRDPQRPSRLLPAYDSGDHLHPSDAGHQAMADAIDLSVF